MLIKHHVIEHLDTAHHAPSTLRMRMRTRIRRACFHCSTLISIYVIVHKSVCNKRCSLAIIKACNQCMSCVQHFYHSSTSFLAGEALRECISSSFWGLFRGEGDLERDLLSSLPSSFDSSRLFEVFLSLSRDLLRERERDLERLRSGDLDRLRLRDLLLSLFRSLEMERDRFRSLEWERSADLERERLRDLDRERERPLDLERERSRPRERLLLLPRERDRDLERLHKIQTKAT